MSECANSMNIGFFNGVFLFFINTGRTFGFIMAAFLIAYLEVSTFFWVLSGFCLFSSSMVCLLPTPIPRAYTPQTMRRKPL